MAKSRVQHSSTGVIVKSARNSYLRWKKLFWKRNYYIKHEKAISFIYFKEEDDLTNMVHTTRKVIESGK